MNLDRRRTTALVERLARVRELQAKQRLARATIRMDEQRLLVEASVACLRDTEQGLVGLLAGDKLDLARTSLYQDLANAQQVTWADGRKTLAACEEARAIRVTELARKSHYREGASDRVSGAVREFRLSKEREQTDELMESWVLRGMRRAPHE